MLKPPTCSGCPLHTIGSGFSKFSGKATHGVVMVGEALGEDEVGPGLPFQGRAGEQLNKMLHRTIDPATNMRFRREDFAVGNCIGCRPPDNVLVGAPYEDSAIQHCSPNLEGFLKATKPRAILALGGTALKRLTGESGIEKFRGYYFDTPYGVVVPTYHPAYILRGKFALQRVWQMDLMRAIAAARGKRPTQKRDYLLRPGIKELEAAFSTLTPDDVIAYDIETPYGDAGKDEEWIALEEEAGIEHNASFNILRISFSWREGWAVTMPWQEPFIGWAKKVLATPNAKTGWNSRAFDNPRLIANGCTLNGPHYDAMLAWHALEPSLPMGLKYVATFYAPDVPPWKTMSFTQPELYSCYDSDVLLRCFNGIKAGLEAQGRWGMFLRHFVDVDEVLREVTRVGVGVDRAARLEGHQDFKARFALSVSALQDALPRDFIQTGKVFAKDEAGLRKIGSWKEGQMLEVEEWITPKPGWRVSSEGWLEREPKPPKPPKAPRVKKAKAKKKDLGEGEPLP